HGISFRVTGASPGRQAVPENVESGPESRPRPALPPRVSARVAALYRKGRVSATGAGLSGPLAFSAASAASIAGFSPQGVVALTICVIVSCIVSKEAPSRDGGTSQRGKQYHVESRAGLERIPANQGSV